MLGGSGFIGGRAVEMLAARGYAVRSASRTARPLAALATVEPFRCDVTDAASVRDAVSGMDLVVAAFVGDARTQIDGVRNLCAALSGSKARLVYLSTAEVYGAASGTLDETAPLVRQGWDYADSKLEAEKYLQHAAAAGLRVNLLRPSIVYGPRCDTWTLELGNNLEARRWGTLGRLGAGTCNLVYVDDLVDALRLALEHESAPGAAFNVNGPDTLTWNEFFTAFNAELGLPPLREWSRAEALLRAGLGQLPRSAKELLGRRGVAGPRVPRVPLAARRAGSEPLAARLLGTLKATPRWRSLTSVYPRSAVYLDHKARRVLGYDPEVRARDGIARSAAWFRREQEGAR